MCRAQQNVVTDSICFAAIAANVVANDTITTIYNSQMNPLRLRCGVTRERKSWTESLPIGVHERYKIDERIRVCAKPISLQFVWK